MHGTDTAWTSWRLIDGMAIVLYSCYLSNTINNFTGSAILTLLEAQQNFLFDAAPRACCQVSTSMINFSGGFHKLISMVWCVLKMKTGIADKTWVLRITVKRIVDEAWVYSARIKENGDRKNGNVLLWYQLILSTENIIEITMFKVCWTWTWRVMIWLTFD